MPQHIGIVACSAEGATLCYRTICTEGPRLLGAHAHPEVSMHTHSLADYMNRIYRGDWPGVGELMLASAHKLAQIGADFLICPDNTGTRWLMEGPVYPEKLARPNAAEREQINLRRRGARLHRDPADPRRLEFTAADARFHAPPCTRRAAAGGQGVVERIA